MKKREIARGWARESRVSQAEAADRLDRVVCQILARLRKGGEAALPGVGTLRQGADGKVTFQCEVREPHD
jgi:hypothetical protein